MSEPFEVQADLALAATAQLLMSGAFGTVRVFLDRQQSSAVEERHRLPDGTPCPVAPICVVEATAAIGPGSNLRLHDREGAPLADVEVTSVEQVTPGKLQIGGRPRPVQDDQSQSQDEHRPLAGLSGAVALPSYWTDPQATAAIAPGAVLFPVPPHEIDDPRPARRIAAWRAACGDQLVVLTTPWAGSGDREVAHRALAAWAGGASGLLLTSDALGLVTSLLPQVPARAATELAAVAPQADQGGTTFFFTGLSGAGKSTIARALAQRVAELGATITLLDGDLVRTHLSDGLGFSRGDRDANVRRISYVAAEVTKHGGIAICAPIAPYSAARRAARDLVECYGRFVLVHVSTPIEVCEQRDVKGLYAKARSGKLLAFTGISDPYEAPAHPEISIDTSRETVAHAVDRLVRFLS